MKPETAIACRLEVESFERFADLVSAPLAEDIDLDIALVVYFNTIYFCARKGSRSLRRA